MREFSITIEWYALPGSNLKLGSDASANLDEK